MEPTYVLQMFVAPWCGSCHALIPIAQQVAKKLSIQIQVLDITDKDVQAELPVVCTFYQLPVFSLQKNSWEIMHHTGGISKELLQQMCKSAMAAG